MPDQPTKEVIKRSKFAEMVVAALTTHSFRAGEPLDALLNFFVREGEDKVNWIQVLNLLGRYLENRTQAMVKADIQHTRELGEDRASRFRRDTIFLSTYNAMVKLRENLRGLYTEEEVMELGLNDETPRQPNELKARVESCLEKVTHRVPWPKPVNPMLPSWTQEGLKGYLEELFAPLQPALDDLARELQESKGTLTLKWNAIDEQQIACSQAAAAGAGLFRLAGEQDLAERIRPPVPERGLLLEGELEEGEGELEEIEGEEAVTEAE